MYEEVNGSPGDFVDMPFSNIADDVWKSTLILSWRWGSSKQEQYVPCSTPMTSAQLSSLKDMLTSMTQTDPNLKHIWCDWSCVPQASDTHMCSVEAGDMSHLMPSKLTLFYPPSTLLAIASTDPQ